MDGAYQKNINGKKCTILWYIDDPNIFFEKPRVLYISLYKYYKSNAVDRHY